MNTYRSQLIDKVAGVIEGSRSLGAVCHERPDGDALGSLLGFAASARLAGKSVSLAVPPPGVIPGAFGFMPTELLECQLDIDDPPQTVLVFDCGSPDRLGELAGVADKVENLVVVDHHASNEGFGTIELIDHRAAATTEILFDLLMELRWPVDAEVATCLLAGLTTDSGRFQYVNTSARTHRVAARLIEHGARPEFIGQKIFEEEPFGLLGVAGAVLARARLEPDCSLVWSSLLTEDLDAASLDVEDTGMLIDLVRLPREAEVAMLVKESGDSGFTVSLRSRGGVDVGSIASALGGGGHHNAAGFKAQGDLREVVASVKEKLAA